MDGTVAMAAGEEEQEGRPTKVLSTKLSIEDFMTCKTMSQELFENKLLKEATISELIRALLTFSISDFKYNNMENVRVMLGALD
jgi:hypothetical protein